MVGRVRWDHLRDDDAAPDRPGTAPDGADMARKGTGTAQVRQLAGRYGVGRASPASPRWLRPARQPAQPGRAAASQGVQLSML